MNPYKVRFSPFARQDLSDSYDWGLENWGLKGTESWLNELESRIFDRLSQMPLAYSVAPESAEFAIEIRQVIYGRYRILFQVRGTEVLVLRIRGPFSG